MLSRASRREPTSHAPALPMLPDRHRPRTRASDGLSHADREARRKLIAGNPQRCRNAAHEVLSAAKRAGKNRVAMFEAMGPGRDGPVVEAQREGAARPEEKDNWAQGV